MKTHKEQTAKKLCMAIATIRAGDRCEICHRQPVQRHHVLFGADKCEPQARYDPDLIAIICEKHHVIYPNAAHKDNKQFLATYLASIDFERGQKIIRILETPYEKTPIDLDVIIANLIEQYKFLEKTSYADLEVDLPINRNWRAG